MLNESRGGDAGVHADHHVLGALVRVFPPPLCSHTATRSNMAAQIALQCDQNQILNLFFFFFTLSLQVWLCN